MFNVAYLHIYLVPGWNTITATCSSIWSSREYRSRWVNLESLGRCKKCTLLLVIYKKRALFTESFWELIGETSILRYLTILNIHVRQFQKYQNWDLLLQNDKLFKFFRTSPAENEKSTFCAIFNSCSHKTCQVERRDFKMVCTYNILYFEPSFRCENRWLNFRDLRRRFTYWNHKFSKHLRRARY